jgi:hypothetical protein
MDECPICLLPLDGTLTTVGCCKKQFHAECHIKCIQQKNECPLCRSKEFIINIGIETPVIETGIQKSARILCYITTMLTVMYTAQFFLKV